MNRSLAVRAAPALLLAGLLTAGFTVPSQAENGGMEHQPTQNAAHARQGMTEQSLVERRIADLHQRLHITSAQKPQWEAFARTMRENARNMDRMYRHRAEHLSEMDAQQDLESYAHLEQARARDVERLVQPFGQLYAALSPQQKQEADHLFRAYAHRHANHAQASSR